MGTGMTDFVLSLVMLAALALVAGAFVLWRRTGEAKQPLLMVLLAVIAVVNVLIWTVPSSTGKAPIEEIKAAGEG
jgi:drug/metabolite transporter superfamily protein YnfA